MGKKSEREFTQFVTKLAHETNKKQINQDYPVIGNTNKYLWTFAKEIHRGNINYFTLSPTIVKKLHDILYNPDKIEKDCIFYKNLKSLFTYFNEKVSLYDIDLQIKPTQLKPISNYFFKQNAANATLQCATIHNYYYLQAILRKLPKEITDKNNRLIVDFVEALKSKSEDGTSNFLHLVQLLNYYCKKKQQHAMISIWATLLIHKPTKNAFLDYLADSENYKDAVKIFTVMKSQSFFFESLLADYQNNVMPLSVLRFFGDEYFVKKLKNNFPSRWDADVIMTIDNFFKKAECTLDGKETLSIYIEECKTALHELTFIIDSRLANRSTLLAEQLQGPNNEKIDILMSFLNNLICDNKSQTNTSKDMKKLIESHAQQAKILFKALLANNHILHSLLESRTAINVIQQNVLFSQLLFDKFNKNKTKWPHWDKSYEKLFTALEPSVLITACQGKQSRTFVPANVVAQCILNISNDKKTQRDRLIALFSDGPTNAHAYWKRLDNSALWSQLLDLEFKQKISPIKKALIKYGTYKNCSDQWLGKIQKKSQELHAGSSSSVIDLPEAMSQDPTETYNSKDTPFTVDEIDNHENHSSDVFSLSLTQEILEEKIDIVCTSYLEAIVTICADIIINKKNSKDADDFYIMIDNIRMAFNFFAKLNKDSVDFTSDDEMNLSDIADFTGEDSVNFTVEEDSVDFTQFSALKENEETDISITNVAGSQSVYFNTMDADQLNTSIPFSTPSKISFFNQHNQIITRPPRCSLKEFIEQLKNSTSNRKQELTEKIQAIYDNAAELEKRYPDLYQKKWGNDGNNVISRHTPKKSLIAIDNNGTQPSARRVLFQ